MKKSLLIDALCVCLFALFARVAHRSPDMPLNFLGWLSTVWPFLVGMGLGYVALLAKRWAPSKLVPAGVTVWLSSVVVGLGIWGWKHSAVPHWSFIIVASTMMAILVLGWRFAFRLVGNRS